MQSTTDSTLRISMAFLFCLGGLSCPELAQAQRIETLGPQARKYVSVSTAKVILEHVEIIDGTGAPPILDRNVTIEGGKITAISAGADQPPVEGATIMNLRGYSIMPGIVGMHNHLVYISRPNPAADGSFDSPAL